MRRCYPVLTPFKLNGTVIKPVAGPDLGPTFVEFTYEEAQQYIDAGVVGEDWTEVPEDDGNDQGNDDHPIHPESGAPGGGGESPAAGNAAPTGKPAAAKRTAKAK